MSNNNRYESFNEGPFFGYGSRNIPTRDNSQVAHNGYQSLGDLSDSSMGGTGCERGASYGGNVNQDFVLSQEGGFNSDDRTYDGMSISEELTTRMHNLHVKSIYKKYLG